jgi:hypothetical protein
VSKPFDNAISARPSRQYLGGTVYTFADGTSLVVYGGSGAAYRGNTPGMNVSDLKRDPFTKNPDLSTSANQSAISAAIKKYGTIGYTLSAGDIIKHEGRTVQLVFSNAETAQAAMRQRFDELGAHGRTVIEVMNAYNGGGNPRYVQYIKDIFGKFRPLLSMPYKSLNASQLETVLHEAMASEGFYNPTGEVTVAPTPTPPGDIFQLGP